jgi:hypothetical protein
MEEKVDIGISLAAEKPLEETTATEKPPEETLAEKDWLTLQSDAAEKAKEA